MAPSFVPGQRATSRARNLVPVRREPEDRWETRNEKVCGGVAAAGGCAAAGRFPFRRARRDDDIFQLPTGRHTGLFSLPTIVPRSLSLSLSLSLSNGSTPSPELIQLPGKYVRVQLGNILLPATFSATGLNFSFLPRSSVSFLSLFPPSLPLSFSLVFHLPS